MCISVSGNKPERRKDIVCRLGLGTLPGGDFRHLFLRNDFGSIRRLIFFA